MRYAGIDIGSQEHVVAVVGQGGELLVPPTRFGEHSEGYTELLEKLGDPKDLLVALEATGHYWCNLFISLAGRGFAVALIHPLSARRFAQAQLQRTKTDAIDAATIAQLAALRRPEPTPLPDELTRELRELVRLRERLVQDLGDRVRELHRVVDLAFPELTEHLSDLGSLKALTVLEAFPTAKSLSIASVRMVSQLCYDGRHKVGESLAKALIAAAKRSVGQHQGAVFGLEVKYFCQDIRTLKERVGELDRDVERQVESHEVASLLRTIDGIGPTTAARLVAALGDPAEWKSADAIAAHLGTVPELKHSGKLRPMRAGISSLGHRRLRHALWMPVLSAIQHNAWLKYHYERLRARGKLAKVALIACMRKLITAVYSVAKNRKPFVPRVPTADQVAPAT